MEQQTPERKKRIFSAIQPSGDITLGNYLGALKNWVSLQDSYDCIFALADLHTITVRQKPADLRHHTLNAYALLLACGIDPKRSLFFLQSHVPAHSQLAWILNCYTQFGELQRMTQFKDKSKKHADNVNAGLFTYPSLMAADILLYQTDFVPVGEDQTQHLELTRNIAERFNNAYSPTFTLPAAFVGKEGKRIMSLQDPSHKMSKSDENVNGCIYVLDKPDDIMRKFKRAITDSEASVHYGEGKDGINNLMEIYSCITGETFDQIEHDFSGKGYGDFKAAVGEAVIEHLRPIQERFAQYSSDRDYMEQYWNDGAEKAARIANRTLQKVMKKVGFIPPHRS
ncbi:tryptophan--tRNA ligase [Caproicibacterium sp. XB2]|jgi:tryptophanyl-tRNA synthetase|uniref:tryptophan--tRNA ligase n=1 Tax=Caproicibacterium TaxID=2834348 RepID=UPI00385039A1